MSAIVTIITTFLLAAIGGYGSGAFLLFWLCGSIAAAIILAGVLIVMSFVEFMRRRIFA